MIKLYAFDFSCSYLGSLHGLFVADEDQVAQAIGQTLHFGDIFRIGRKITYTLREADLRVRTEDQEFIEKLIDVAGDWTISGTNPLHFTEEAEQVTALPEPKTAADRLMTFRARRDSLTTGMAADMCGVDRRTWEDYEAGEQEPPACLWRLIAMIDRYGPLPPA